MLQSIINLINSMFVNCTFWFSKIMNASKVSDYYFTFLLIALSIRFLIMPLTASVRITGGDLSDHARKYNNRSKSNNDSSKKSGGSKNG